METAVFTIRQGGSVIAENVAASYRTVAGSGGLLRMEGELRLPSGPFLGVGEYDVTDADGNTGAIAIHRAVMSSSGIPPVQFTFKGKFPKD